MRLLICDIVVVGAGPAGSLTARSAAEHGVNVILIEEHSRVGYPVYCAEGLSIDGIHDAGLEPVSPYVSQKINKARVYAPNKKYIDLSSKEWSGFNLNRVEFDGALARNAVYAGAELMLETRATGVIKDGSKVIGVTAISKGEPIEIKSKIVIGAEGHSSIIRRTSGFQRWFGDATPVAQFQLSGLKLENPHSNDFHIGREICPGGYGWVFPKSETVANVGLGVRLFNKGSALQYLRKWVNSDPQFRGSKIISITGGVCPVSGVFDRIVGDGVMLVGDAAGQMIPMTGAGIHTGVAAGKIGGEIAAKAINEGDVSATRLEEYVKRFDNVWGKRIRDAGKVLEMLDSFEDKHFNTLVDIIEPEDIINLTNGTNTRRTIAKLIARSPLGIIGLMSAYLR